MNKMYVCLYVKINCLILISFITPTYCSLSNCSVFVRDQRTGAKGKKRHLVSAIKAYYNATL